MYFSLFKIKIVDNKPFNRPLFSLWTNIRIEICHLCILYFYVYIYYTLTKNFFSWLIYRMVAFSFITFTNPPILILMKCYTNRCFICVDTQFSEKKSKWFQLQDKNMYKHFWSEQWQEFPTKLNFWTMSNRLFVDTVGHVCTITFRNMIICNWYLLSFDSCRWQVFYK